MSQSFWKKGFRLIVTALAICFAVDLGVHIIVEILWFQEVGYLSTLVRRFSSKLLLWAIASGLSILFLLFNLNLAFKLKWESPAEKSPFLAKKSLIPLTPALNLSLVLPIIWGFCLLIALMLLYYSQVALQVWKPDFNLPNIIPPLPSPLKISALAREMLPQISGSLRNLGVVLTVIIVIFINSEFFIKAIAIIFSLLFGFILSGNWTIFLQNFHPSSFNQTEPLFHNNIDFYVFHLPLWQLLYFWLGGLFLYSVIGCCLIYLFSGNSISEGKFIGFSSLQIRHLYILFSLLFLLAIAPSHWLTRYELLYSDRGVVYGASYTDVKLQLPIETGLAVLATFVGMWLLFRAVFKQKARQPPPIINQIENLSKYSQSSLLIPKLPGGFWFVFLYIGAVAITSLFTLMGQRLIVQPNELALEKPYIERNIAFTRQAFNLDNIEAKTFNPEGKLTAADIKKNHLTIDNIRLWDTRPLLQTNRQLQQIRLYYQFFDADIDRYNLKFERNFNEKENNNTPQIIEEKQQVIIAARELDYNAVPAQAKTWVNEHLVYTHGYGFTLSPVNKVGEAGLPEYFIKDIGIGTQVGEEGALNTSSQLIRDSIPIGKPRIYYGELTNTNILTSTTVKELDFPSGEDNVYNTYDGTGGIKIGLAKRWLFAEYFKDWRMLFAENFTPETKILFRRNINLRIRKIAPFLRYDGDPYLVAADLGQKNYLYWIIDAYTTSDHYPYSEPGEGKFNYIRNSIKVVVNAYNGDVNFYIADENDPIIQTWNKIFPELFKPLAEMPINLRKHLRYPVDLFSAQSERLLTYHMLDPQVFYNREDQWEIPQEIYGNSTQPIEPYYLIMKLPTETSEEFILLHPYTPTSRPNLIAWLAGRSDNQQYGKLLLYQFPKQKLIYGPDQVEALINQDPIISQQISLWNRQGSKAIQGNLLVIPIEQSLLYVEPLYLEAEKNSLPALARVIVVYENRIIMAETLPQALDAVFTPQKEATPAIIRPVENGN